jgi:hypothetical protein
MRSPSCLCVCESLHVKFRIPGPVFTKLGMYIMAPELISTAYFINPSRQSVSVCVPSIVARQILGKVYSSFAARQWYVKHVPTSTNTRINRRNFERVCLQVCLCVPLSLLSNNAVEMFPRHRRTVGGVVFHASLSYERKVGDNSSQTYLLFRVVTLPNKYKKVYANPLKPTDCWCKILYLWLVIIMSLSQAY